MSLSDTLDTLNYFEDESCIRETCFKCSQKVFPVERVVHDSQIWHRCCFRCQWCRLMMLEGSELEGTDELYCKDCYPKALKAHREETRRQNIDNYKLDKPKAQYTEYQSFKNSDNLNKQEKLNNQLNSGLILNAEQEEKFNRIQRESNNDEVNNNNYGYKIKDDENSLTKLPTFDHFKNNDSTEDDNVPFDRPQGRFLDRKSPKLSFHGKQQQQQQSGSYEWEKESDLNSPYNESYPNYGKSAMSSPACLDHHQIGTKNNNKLDMQLQLDEHENNGVSPISSPIFNSIEANNNSLSPPAVASPALETIREESASMAEDEQNTNNDNDDMTYNKHDQQQVSVATPINDEEYDKEMERIMKKLEKFKANTANIVREIKD